MSLSEAIACVSYIIYPHPSFWTAYAIYLEYIIFSEVAHYSSRVGHYACLCEAALGACSIPRQGQVCDKRVITHVVSMQCKSVSRMVSFISVNTVCRHDCNRDCGKSLQLHIREIYREGTWCIITHRWMSSLWCMYQIFVNTDICQCFTPPPFHHREKGKQWLPCTV